MWAPTVDNDNNSPAVNNTPAVNNAPANNKAPAAVKEASGTIAEAAGAAVTFSAMCCATQEFMLTQLLLAPEPQVDLETAMQQMKIASVRCSHTQDVLLPH